VSALTNVIGAKIVVGCSSRTRWEQHVTEEEEEEEEEGVGGGGGGGRRNCDAACMAYPRIPGEAREDAYARIVLNTHIHTHARTHARTHVHARAHTHSVCVCVCLCVNISRCTCVIYVCIYHTRTHMQTWIYTYDGNLVSPWKPKP